MHQDDSQARNDTLSFDRCKLRPQLIDVKLILHDIALPITTLHNVLALFTYFVCVLRTYPPAMHFHDPFVYRRRHLNLQVKDLWAGHVPDLKSVAQTLGNEKRHVVTFAFK